MDTAPRKLPARVYVAGPFRGPTAWAIAQNVRRAEEIGHKVADAGCSPLIPHANTAHFHGLGPDAFWLDATLAWLRVSEAVALAPRWSESSGTLAEVAEAHRLGLPVFRPEASESVIRMWADMGHVRPGSAVDSFALAVALRRASIVGAA